MVFAKAAKKRNSPYKRKLPILLTLRKLNVKKIFRTSKLKLIIGLVLLTTTTDLLIATQSNLFSIHSIICFNQKLPCNQKIITQLEHYKGQNLLQFDQEGLKRDLLHNFPQITAITTLKKLPGNLEVHIALREPVAMILDGQGKYFFVDKNFKAYLEAYDPKLPLIESKERISLGASLVSPAIVTALTISQTLEESLLPVKQIQIVDQDHLEVQLFSQKTVIFSGNKDVLSQVDSLLFILDHADQGEQNIKNIDLRFDNPVIK
ncbi:hypothetical protein GYA49_03900 [Candidatus Beckwithbacteria bacterium]|nr:hypothetical protein [Candidatus Beckwithbacteria bacterium]